MTLCISLTRVELIYVESSMVLLCSFVNVMSMIPGNLVHYKSHLYTKSKA